MAFGHGGGHHGGHHGGHSGHRGGHHRGGMKSPHAMSKPGMSAGEKATKVGGIRTPYVQHVGPGGKR